VILFSCKKQKSWSKKNSGDICKKKEKRKESVIAKENKP
jgi:hypothetical protein